MARKKKSLWEKTMGLGQDEAEEASLESEQNTEAAAEEVDAQEVKKESKQESDLKMHPKFAKFKNRGEN